MIQLTATENTHALVSIELPTSKSIANRELILCYLSGAERPILRPDLADDIHILANALYSDQEVWDLGHAGTAMRFATALACIGDRTRVLQGSERMHLRPIGILVDALRKLGADITYMGQEGFPPLRIEPVKKLGGTVTIDGSVSSQYISALLLIASHMDTGLELEITPPLTSRPYVNLTLDVMRSKGVNSTREGHSIRVEHQVIDPCVLSDHRDWSAAAFFYGLVAQGHPREVYFPQLEMESSQGDSELIRLFDALGVGTEPHQNGLRIFHKESTDVVYKADLSDQPDLAQAIAFTCASLGRSCHLTGLHTLRIKETDRIAAIKECLEAVGCQVEADEDSMRISAKANSAKAQVFKSYDDHRMAMAISILSPALGSLFIEDEGVVSKSFPNYWDVLEESGIMSLVRT